VLACVSAAEAAFVQRFPGYHHVKLLLLLWLQSRRYQGAARLFRLLLRPALHQLRPSTEAFLARAAALAVRCVPTQAMHLTRRHWVHAWFACRCGLDGKLRPSAEHSLCGVLCSLRSVQVVCARREWGAHLQLSSHASVYTHPVLLHDGKPTLGSQAPGLLGRGFPSLPQVFQLRMCHEAPG